jgi:SIR2-like domain
MRDRELTDALFSEIARHKVLPFIGAGCSFGHLQTDWDAVRDQMASEAMVPATEHCNVASAYVSKYGRDELIRLLKDNLHVESFVDEKGASYLALLGLNLSAYYTTNQDNIFELCSTKYGRPFRTIVDIGDFKSAQPGEQYLYKFHGSLEKPETVVFTAEDYERRMGLSPHPLDIRLRSDAIAKSLLFIGYSFRDPNIRQVLSMLKKVFGNQLPNAYLVEFNSDEEFEVNVKAEYGVDCIAPNRLYSTDESAIAFERFVAEMLESVFRLRHEKSMHRWFMGDGPRAIPTAMPMEIQALRSIAIDIPVEEAIKKFRCTIDGRRIPMDHEKLVVQIFTELCRNADVTVDRIEFIGALSNMFVTEVIPAMEALAACMTVGRFLQPRVSFLDRSFLPPTGRFGSKVYLPAAAMAISFLFEWKIEITPGFLQCLNDWSHSYEPLESYPHDLQVYIEHWFMFAFPPGQSGDRNPLDKMAKSPGSNFRDGRFDENRIRDDMLSLFPQRPIRPYNE